MILAKHRLEYNAIVIAVYRNACWRCLIDVEESQMAQKLCVVQSTASTNKVKYILETLGRVIVHDARCTVNIGEVDGEHRRGER